MRAMAAPQTISASESLPRCLDKALPRAAGTRQTQGFARNTQRQRGRQFSVSNLVYRMLRTSTRAEQGRG